MDDRRLSVEQLTDLLGVDAEDVDSWQELGLLRVDPDGRYDADAVERVRLIRFATDRDIPAVDIARLSELQGSDVMARYVEFLGGPRPPGISLEDAAETAGLPVAVVQRYRIAASLAADEELFDADIEMMRTGATALALGMPEEALLQIVRVLSDALTRVADAESRLFHIYVHQQLRAAGLPEPELVETVRSMSDPLMELVEPSILYFHRRAWVRAALEDMVVHLREDLEPHQGQVGETSVAVLFADLASFMPLTEAMGDTEAAHVLDRFSDLVREAAARGAGRVLKQIGDEFMVVFPIGAAAVTCGLEISRRAGQEPQFPAVRIGVHSGTALYREADYLGATVNIAARVAAEAERGQFLATAAVRADAADLSDVRFDSIGHRSLKGMAESVELFEVHLGREHPDRVVDPVCGMELHKASAEQALSWGGQDLFFCSKDCRDLFVQAPDRYQADGRS